MKNRKPATKKDITTMEKKIKTEDNKKDNKMFVKKSSVKKK
jgi:hypothetical protein